MGTSFIVGDEHTVMLAKRSTALYYVTDQILLCGKHTRGMKLQPFMDNDHRAGFGRYGCPFCVGGLLENTFSLHRSQHKILRALDRLDHLIHTGAFGAAYKRKGWTIDGWTEAPTQDKTAHYYDLQAVEVLIEQTLWVPATIQHYRAFGVYAVITSLGDALDVDVTDIRSPLTHG